MASLLVLPREWTSTMKPLQDKCEPTPYEDIEAMFRSDMGAPVSDLFGENLRFLSPALFKTMYLQTSSIPCLLGSLL
jgi:hypothetical protein